MRLKNINISKTVALAPPAAVIIIWAFELALSSKFFQNIQIYSSNAATDLASSLRIRKGEPAKCNNEPRYVKIWISPYRPFPEAGDPGRYASRGLGDYEYLSLLRGDPCARLKVNYGASKYSPAHIVFDKARSEGIAAEMIAAKKLGFDTFALDLNKVWITTDEFKQRCQPASMCRITSDNFALINLKDEKANPGIIKIMHHVVAKPNGPPIEYWKELMGFNSNEWEPIEASPDGRSLLSWSKGLGVNNIFLLGGKRLASLPFNLDVILKPASSIVKLDLRMNCSNGTGMRKLTVSKDISISTLLRDCQPESIEVEGFSTTNSQAQVMPTTLQVPTLSQNDTRQSIFAIAANQ